MAILKNCEIKNEEYKIEIYIEVYTWHVRIFYWMNISHSELECFLCTWLSACMLHEFSKSIFSKIEQKQILLWTKKFNSLFSTYFACKITFDSDCVHSKICTSYFEL